MFVFGTRPEAIKMAPLIKEAKADAQFDVIVCISAQHREMLDMVLDRFAIKVDYDLNIMSQHQTLDSITTKVIEQMEPILINEKPDMVLVHGDTTTTFAAALSAFYHQIDVGHVEAGLRTYSKYSPYPEEMNRNLVGRLADLHFAPTQQSRDNLLRENIDAQKIVVTGNTAIDALKTTVVDDYRWDDDYIEGGRLLLLTAHRRENLCNLNNIFNVINCIINEYPDVKVLYPIHKNPAIKKLADEILQNHERIKLIEPMDVLDFHNVINKAYLVLTDSGGIQEEAPSLGKPVLVLRDTTERPEGIQAGVLKLVGTDEKTIYENVKQLLDNQTLYDTMAQASNPYGDGNASQKILKSIAEYFKNKR